MSTLYVVVRLNCGLEGIFTSEQSAKEWIEARGNLFKESVEYSPNFGKTFHNGLLASFARSGQQYTINPFVPDKTGDRYLPL